MRSLFRSPLPRRTLRRAGIAGVCTLAAATAAACGSSGTPASSSSSGLATVTYWTSGTQAEISYIDTQFDKAHPGIKAALFNKGKQLGIALGGVGDYVLF